MPRYARRPEQGAATRIPLGANVNDHMAIVNSNRQVRKYLDPEGARGWRGSSGAPRQEGRAPYRDHRRPDRRTRSRAAHRQLARDAAHGVRIASSRSRRRAPVVAALQRLCDRDPMPAPLDAALREETCLPSGREGGLRRPFRVDIAFVNVHTLSRGPASALPRTGLDLDTLLVESAAIVTSTRTDFRWCAIVRRGDLALGIIVRGAKRNRARPRAT